MAYQEWSVAPGLELWTVDGPAGTQRILPDGCLDLLLDGERLLVAGPDSAARVHRRRAGVVSGVRLHAGRGPALLGVPADELRDLTVPLDSLWGDRRTRRLAAAVGGSPRALARWARDHAPPDEVGTRLVGLLSDGASVGAAAEALGYSTRQLHRRSLPVFGYGPQHLARVLRLGRAVALAEAGERWASVAVRAGYADQAHLAREVRALAGTSPSSLRGERVRSVQEPRGEEGLASRA